MKRILLAGATLLALSAAQPAVAQPMPVFNWSGFYIGGNVGYAWGTANWNGELPTLAQTFPVSTSPNGWLGGVHAGVQQQWGSLVAGVEVSWDGGRVRGNTTVFENGLNRDYFSAIDSIFIVAGRLGVASNNWLFYGKAGYANAEITLDKFRQSDGDQQAHAPGRAGGIVLGVGTEYAFAPNWIFGLEYNFMKFYVGDRNNVDTPGFITHHFTNIDVVVHALMARLSWKFGG